MAKQTARQKQAKRIAGSKRKQQRTQRLRHYVMLPVAVLTLAAFGIGGWVIVQSGIVEQNFARAERAVLEQTVEAGFSLKRITITGRDKTSQKRILGALGVGLKESVFKASMADAKEAIESISSVRKASVSRVLPGTINITIEERKPAAIWQYRRQLSVIDADGEVLFDENPKDYPHLLVIVGKEVPGNLDHLLALLGEEPDLAGSVTSAVRVGGRRWNLKMNSGVEVLLPEENPAEALRQLAEMQIRQGVLQKAISAIDMRLGKRVFIRLDKSDEAADVEEGADI